MPRARSRARSGCVDVSSRRHSDRRREAPKGGAMIITFLALQLAASAPLGIRAPGQALNVATIPTANGPMISVDALGRVIPLKATRDSASWYTLTVWGVRMQL